MTGGMGLHGRNAEPLMSALGQKRTLRHVGPMSALPPKADKQPASPFVRFVPKADIVHRAALKVHGYCFA